MRWLLSYTAQQASGLASWQRDTHCGCASPGKSPSHSSIVFHARKGERPRVVVKLK